MSNIPLRTEVSVSDTWDLSPLYPSDGAWEEDFDVLQKEFPAAGRFRDHLMESANVLAECLEFEKTVDLRIERLNQFASLRVTEDSSNAPALDREARLESLLVRVGEAFSFIAPEIQSLPDETFDAYLTAEVLSEWTIPLRKLRRMRAHTLSVAEERLMALGSSALRGHGETFSQLTNVDMKFGSLLDGDGNERELTQSSFSSFLQQRDPAVRRAAFHQFYAEFSDHKFTLAASLTSSVRADVFQARARNYPSAREAALFGDDVPAGVYDGLISTVRNNLGALFDYFELRREVLGLGEIHHYDTYVPMVENIQADVPWDQAVERVLEAVAPLGEEYVKTLGRGLSEGRWCDRYENKGKRSGAFSYGTFTSPPYIMMNYKVDVFSDVYTLAHEAGHSMHTWYSQREQLYQNYHYPIFLAEVASTFNEILLTEHLLKTTDDKRIYRRLLADYFGPRFALDQELEIECLRIPHFYNAFYVYKYATGISAAAALAARVLESGDPSGYLAFLKSGGNRYPIETLAAAGVDMSGPAPVQAALDLFTRRVGDLRELLG